MDLTQEDSGSEKNVSVGEEITLRLPETPTTGYRWHAEVDADALELIADRYEGAVEPRGAGGVRVLGFVARRPGELALRVVKRRSWEQQAAEEFVVRLRVAAR